MRTGYGAAGRLTTCVPLHATVHRRSRRGQRGQALIEFSMFFVFMMFLLTGVTDIAGLLDVHIAVVYAARQGARTGSVMGPVTGADCAIVGAIHASLISQPSLTATQIIIYQATSTTNGKYTGTQNAEIYPGNSDCRGTLIETQNPVTLVWTPVTPSVNTWPSTTRNNSPFTEDSLGVEIDYSYQFQFNLLGTNFSASDYAVVPMNPSGTPTPTPTV